MSNSFSQSYSPPSSPPSSSSSDGFERRRAERMQLQTMMFSQLLQFQAQNTPQQIEPQIRRRRKYIDRNREDGHQRLYNDYFANEPVYSSKMFRRRFRMQRHFFLCLVHAAESSNVYFQQRCDATGRPGLSALQKCTAAIRMLAYGESADRVDEYLRLGESTARECLIKFVEVVITQFGEEYMRSPTVADAQRLLQINESCGFPGSSNDLNVLHRSPVFDDLLNGRAPRVNYWVNGHHYNTAYYLTDGIYPRWETFISSIRHPQTPKDRCFSKRQESVRKDVECAFGVLQARFAIIRKPALSWDTVILHKVMTACIILHNMIVEDERDTYVGYDDAYEYVEYQNEEAETTAQDPEYGIGYILEIHEFVDNRDRMENSSRHLSLRNDLFEHIWQKFNHLG